MSRVRSEMHFICDYKIFIYINKKDSLFQTAFEYFKIKRLFIF